ncbi:MAG: sigma-70 family RNA polymerase sigma factor [Chloroflexi bacterium]|nr:sigma-70 family RNA polymerase sigma factor [Chloroflexota bacterium]
MSQGEDQISAIEQALQQVRFELGGTLADAIQPVLYINNQRCRIRQYKSLRPTGTVKDYVFQVANHYVMDRNYLDAIQKQKSIEVWEPLLEKIRQWTYSFLGKWNLLETTRASFTLEIAQETGLEIIRSHYPYDSDFDGWACIVTHHVCSKFMKRFGASAVIDNMDLSEADEWFLDSDNTLQSDPEIMFAKKQLLSDAIAQLSANQRSVIWHFYFEGWSLPHIANHLGISTNAIYKRHFDALKQLRKILG